MKENGVQTIVEGEVWRQDYKMPTLVYPRSQNIGAWMVKIGCVNITVSSSEKTDRHADQKQEINFVWPSAVAQNFCS